MIKKITSLESGDSFEWILKSENDFFPYPWGKQQWQELDFTERYSLYISKSLASKKLMGFALYDCAQLPNSLHLLKVFVEPEFRGKGLADKLLQASIDEYRPEQIFLEVAEDNQSAIGFYKRFGFETLTLKKRFYSDGKAAFAMLLKCD